MSKKFGGWPADMEARRAAGDMGLIESLPPVDCAPDDRERDRWNEDGTLDGFEFRCEQHPGQEIFIACGGGDPEETDPGNEDCADFQVRKNGENTNILADGTVGVPKWAHENHDMGDTIDVLCAKCMEYADLWDLRNNELVKERR